ncbi:MAG: DUF1007 family protein [Pseudomonadota bacterium]
MALGSGSGLFWARACLGLFLCQLCCLTCVLAHPHVFADYSFDAVFDAGGLKGVEVSWTFDEMFSAEIIREFHTSQGKTFTPAETEELLTVAFAELPQVEYFTLLMVDGTARPVKQIRDFSAFIKGKKLCCKFFVPCTVRGDSKPRRLDMLVRDDEFFIDFQLLVPRPLSLQDSRDFRTHMSVKKDHGLAYYSGRVIPSVVTLSFWREK